MKRAVLKWNKSNSEHTECDLRFNDTYHLYKYNIGGINCHHISVKDQKTIWKWIKSNSEYNTRFKDTYNLYKYNFGIHYHHNRTEIEINKKMEKVK